MRSRVLDTGKGFTIETGGRENGAGADEVCWLGPEPEWAHLLVPVFSCPGGWQLQRVRSESQECAGAAGRWERPWTDGREGTPTQQKVTSRTSIMPRSVPQWHSPSNTENIKESPMTQSRPHKEPIFNTGRPAESAVVTSIFRTA